MEKIHLNLSTGAGAADLHKRKRRCEQHEYDLTDWLSIKALFWVWKVSDLPSGGRGQISAWTLPES